MKLTDILKQPLPNTHDKSLQCKPARKKPKQTDQLKPSSVQDKDSDNNSDSDYMQVFTTFDTSFHIKDLHRKHIYNPLLNSISALNLPEEEKQSIGLVSYRVAIIPVNQFSEYRNSSMIITFPPDSASVENSEIKFKKEDVDYFTAIESYNKKQPGESEILSPHQISCIFPIFKDVHSIIKHSTVSQLIKKIEDEALIDLSFPLIAGVLIEIFDNSFCSAQVFKRSESLIITLYISMRATERLSSHAKIKLSDISSMRDSITTAEQMILIMHERMKCPIVFVDNDINHNEQYRIINIHNSLDIQNHTKNINDKLKHYKRISCKIS